MTHITFHATPAEVAEFWPDAELAMKAEVAGVVKRVMAPGPRDERIAALEAERNKLRGALANIFAHFGCDENLAPGHGHEIPGVWDDDAGNGELAGKPCFWCAQWAAARATLKDQPND